MNTAELGWHPLTGESSSLELLDGFLSDPVLLH
jgi:hypothetical protein